MQVPLRPTVCELNDSYRARALSPVEVVRETLRRIEGIDSALNAFVTVTGEHALRRAMQAEAEILSGRIRGPLHGVPYAAKDILDTRGIRTTIGSKLMSENIPDRDAAVIERLDEAGAILVGKAGLHEWAYGITSTNPHFGAVRNPWDTARIPGGSSGGSAAALAAGLCVISIGSDTGGSIRIPAALCGIAGLKPTFGRISRYGAYPLGHTLDTLGPFGVCVEDVALAYRTMARPDPRDPVSCDRPPRIPEFADAPRLDGTVIGIPGNFYFDHLAPDIGGAVAAAVRTLEELGAELREVPVPDIDLGNTLHRLILLAEGTSVHRRRLEGRRDDFGDDVRALLDQGRFVLATDYIDAQRARREFCRGFDAAMEQVDALVAPAVPIPTARVGELEIEVGGKLENVRLATTRNIRALNLTGLPVLSVPCGFDREGMPVGLQVVGRMYDEERILAIGHAYESATAWHKRIPPILREYPTGSDPTQP